MSKKTQFCQSCGMPMSEPKDFGTEKDGKPSKEYCCYCYQKGKWTAPDMTYDEMLKIGLKGLDENNEMNKFSKFFIKKMYPSQLKHLKRWRNK